MKRVMPWNKPKRWVSVDEIGIKSSEGDIPWDAIDRIEARLIDFFTTDHLILIITSNAGDLVVDEEMTGYQLFREGLRRFPGAFEKSRQLCNQPFSKEVVVVYERAPAD